MGCAASIKPNKTGQCNCPCHRREDISPKLTKKERLQLLSVQDDPRLPLSGRQIYLIQKSWKAIARNMVGTGINMFLSLFERNEDVRMYFHMVEKGATLSELRESKVLEAHARTVMLTIDEAIMALDDADLLLETLNTIAISHRKIFTFDPALFWLIKEPFLFAVKETLGDRFSPSLAYIYDKAISFVLKTLEDGFSSRTNGHQNGKHMRDDDGKRL